jgi:subtilisin family serine protease
MKRFACVLFSVLLFTMALVPPAEAAGTRVIVRVQGGLPVLQSICRLLHCTVNYGLGDPDDQVFLVTLPVSLLQNVLLNTLQLKLGVLSVEVDVQGDVLAGSPARPSIPAALYDSTPVEYYGATVRRGYVNQPAAQILRIAAAQSEFHVDGTGIVAVIDTGVDTHHPALIPVLLPGYDFTRNRESADELGDVRQSTASVVDGTGPVWVNQSTASVVDQSTASVVDGTGAEAFGHGTMVAGIIHLVAPRAYILPLKAFNADGSGYKSDVIRAIYRAVNSNARVLNMSFSFASSSSELNLAITYANLRHVICVASAGNDGRSVTVYPASYTNRVMGVASTSDADTRSSFSNYGATHVWVAAPGEGIVTTYPWGAYAASWGTSFSAPFVAGTAALLLDVSSSADQSNAAQSIAHAKFISSDLGKGRLDIYQAVAAWRQSLGLR